MSPVIQSGISIELQDYFDEGYGLFQGVVSPCQLFQMLHRVRSQIELSIFMPKRSFNAISNFNDKAIAKENYLELLNGFVNSNFFSGDNEFDNDFNSSFVILDKREDELACFIASYKAKLQCVENIEFFHYREIFKLIAKSKNYAVEFIEKTPSENDPLIPLQAIKKELLGLEATEISEAKLLDEIGYKNLSKKPAPNRKERSELNRYMLFAFLPLAKINANLVLNLWLKNKDVLIGTDRFLKIFAEDQVKIQDKNSLDYHLSKSIKNDFLCFTDFRSRAKYNRLFESLNLQKYLPVHLRNLDRNSLINETFLPQTFENFGMSYDFYSKDFDEFRITLDDNKKLLRKSFNIKFTQKTKTVDIAKKIFNLFGHDLKLIKVKGEGDQFYRLQLAITNTTFENEVSIITHSDIMYALATRIVKPLKVYRDELKDDLILREKLNLLLGKNEKSYDQEGSFEREKIKKRLENFRDTSVSQPYTEHEIEGDFGFENLLENEKTTDLDFSSNQLLDEVENNPSQKDNSEPKKTIPKINDIVQCSYFGKIISGIIKELNKDYPTIFKILDGEGIDWWFNIDDILVI